MNYGCLFLKGTNDFEEVVFLFEMIEIFFIVRTLCSRLGNKMSVREEHHTYCNSFLSLTGELLNVTRCCNVSASAALNRNSTI